nr:MAG TPA: hypothetical protein [Crassvirales sp.]
MFIYIIGIISVPITYFLSYSKILYFTAFELLTILLFHRFESYIILIKMDD